MSQSHHTREIHGGSLVANVLRKQGVEFLFTLCGGHISPIFVAAKEQGIRVVDVRHEATTVFAADAVARLTGVPGVAAVTAGPGVTNTVTAVKNAQMAQSPVIVLGGATATMLKGRGALQDIDQMSLMRPNVKWARVVNHVRDIIPTLERAFTVAQSDVPGPVFVELPVDLLYPEPLVRGWYDDATPKGQSLTSKATRWYLNRHVNHLFADAWEQEASEAPPPAMPQYTPHELEKAREYLQQAERPVLVISSQVLLSPADAGAVQQAVMSLGIPTYLSSMARGLLGHHPLHMRHKRSKALKEADLVLLMGVAQDFRMNYGRSVPSRTPIVSVNLSSADLKQNRKPTVGILGHPGRFLTDLAAARNGDAGRWQDWFAHLKERNDGRDTEIAEVARQETDFLNPLYLCQQIEELIAEDSVIIGDGGDFVATASYIVRPRAPLSWLDPGPFGTLGSGAGFALGAKLVRPNAEVWLLYGDGSAGYTIAEFDTFRRHDLPVIAVVGNDGVWAQIEREQTEIFADDVATRIGRADYHEVAAGFGARGMLLDCQEEIRPCLQEAQDAARNGRSVLVNALIGKTDFRKGSISM